jgi:nucleoid-associated protein YgaU
MALAAQKFSSDPRIRQIRAHQKEIEKYIGRLIAEIERIDSGDTINFWVLIQETGKGGSYRAVLQMRLRALRRQLRSLRRQRRELRLAIIQSNARKVRQKNRLAAKRLLRSAEKRGELSHDEEEKLARYTEASLKSSLAALEDKPTGGTMRLVLKNLEDVMLVGGSDDAIDAAFKQLKSASGKRRRRLERQFRANPSKDNLKRMMRGVAEGMLFASEDEGWPPQPEGLSVNWPEKQHHVVPGDTLASISEQYYGSPAYWDQVYLANVGVIGDNIDTLRPHIMLRIPGNRR